MIPGPETTMRILVDQIPERGFSMVLEERPETFPVLDDIQKAGHCEFLSSIKFRLSGIRVQDVVEIKGAFEVPVRLSCCRCLKIYPTSLTSDFELIYAYHPDGFAKGVDEEEIELRARDVGVIFFQNEEIHLMEGLQEQVVMSIPMQSWCTETCKGLCPRCGGDLNLGDCGCEKGPVDSRFAALKDFKVKQG
jgi:DUF177 domain-containing protein